MAVDTQNAPLDVEFNSPNRAFLDTLEARRALVFKHVRALPHSERTADFLFDLLTRLANKGRLDPASIAAFHSKSEHLPTPPAELELSLPEGVTLTLEQALTFGAPPPSTHDVLSALLAMGLNGYLKRKAPEERRAVIKRVVKLLPGVERLGNFVLTDFVDYACDTQEATMFWQLYVDHVAKVLEQRTTQSEEDEAPPVWTLSALLELELEAPNALIGRRWELLRKHIGRILQCPQDTWRWRFARVLVEKCLDHRLLYALITSPALIEDEQVLFKFLTRCHAKHISCALFVLQVGPGSRELLDDTLRYFEDQPLAEIGERALDVYTQLQLIERPSRALQVFKEALLSLLTHKLDEEPVDMLLGYVKNNASAFRQCTLLVDLVPSDRNTLKPRDHQLLERVLQSFFHAFTPLGVRHPLNNNTYHDAVVRAIVSLMRDEQSAHAATIKSFTLNLPGEAHRWLPDEVDEPKRKLLLTYFMALTAQVLRRAARRLHASPKTRPKAHQLYHLLIELYIAHPQEGIESGAYGPLVPIVHALYPDLTSSEYLEPPEASRLQALAELFGRVEEELLASGYLDGLLDQWTDRNRGRDLVEAPLEEEALPAEPTPLPAETAAPLRARLELEVARTLQTPVVLLPKRTSATSSALRAYLGLDLLAYLSQQALSLIGVKRTGDLIYSPQRITLRQHYEDTAGQGIAHKEVSFPHEQLAEVQLSQPLMSFHYLLGLLTLITSTLIGGYLLFAGVRGSESTLIFLGLASVLFGFLFDAAANKRAEAAAQRVIIELSRTGQARPLAFSIDRSTHHGQALINALTAREALKNEVSFQEDWVALSEQLSLAEEAASEQEREAQEALRQEETRQAEALKAKREAEMADMDALEEAERQASLNPEPVDVMAVIDALDSTGDDPRVLIGEQQQQRAPSEPPAQRSTEPKEEGGLNTGALVASFDALQGDESAPELSDAFPDDSVFPDDSSIMDDSLLDESALSEAPSEVAPQLNPDNLDSITALLSAIEEPSSKN